MKKKSIITIISLTLICLSFNLTHAQAIYSDSLRINREGDISILIKTKSKSNHVFNRTIKWINSTYQNPEKVIVGQLQNESISVSGYKQDVFKYHHLSGELEFLWCIPSKERYWHIINNKYQYLSNKQTERLAQFVLLMESGALLKWAQRENGELPDAIISLNKGT